MFRLILHQLLRQKYRNLLIALLVLMAATGELNITICGHEADEFRARIALSVENSSNQISPTMRGSSRFTDRTNFVASGSAFAMRLRVRLALAIADC